MSFLRSLYLQLVKIGHSLKDDEDAIAGASNVESTPKIFQLNVDCLNEIFEYLCVKDLHSFGQTCKRMNKVAGEYFKQNHLVAKNYFKKHGIYTEYRHGTSVTSRRILYNYSKPIEISGFKKFIPRLVHGLVLSPTRCHNDPDAQKFIKSHIDEFESIKHFSFVHTDISNRNIKCFKKLWPQLECLHFELVNINGDLYDIILKYCRKNLRQLYVYHSELGSRKFVKFGKFKWLLQKYPKLECLHLVPTDFCRLEELREFFIRNPNLRKFSTRAIFFWDHGDIFLNSNIKLDILEITDFWLHEGYSSSATTTSKTLVELLNRLHAQGFYKRLYVYMAIRDDELANKLALIEGLEFVYVREFYKTYNLHHLVNLKELMIQDEFEDADAEILAYNLTRLERLCIYGLSSFDDIMPFIRQSLKLRKILFIPDKFRLVLNLVMLNEERAKLDGAQKIIIYVRDDCFLATKWATKNGDTNLNFIEMRKSDSIEWNPLLPR